MIDLENNGGGKGSGGGFEGTRSYLPMKNMLPETLDNKIERWRPWRNAVLSFLDTKNVGMKAFLE